MRVLIFSLMRLIRICSMRILQLALIPILCFAADPYGNPPSYTCDPSIRTFLYGEPFFASIREDGTAFAIRSSPSGALQGKIAEPSVRWRPGFRIGCGVHLDHDSWEGSVDWTYFRNNFIQSLETPFLTPLFIDASSYSQIPQGFFQHAKEQWKFSLNSLCFLIYRPYFLSEQLGIVPQVGLFANWIDQNFAIFYRSDALTSGVVAFQTTIENDSWKVGPFLGTRIDWYIKKEVRLFGALKGGALYRKVFAEQQECSSGNSQGDVRIFLVENVSSIQPWLDCQFGFGWGACLNCAKNFLEVTFLYETQYFWHELYSRTLFEQIPDSQNRFLNNLGDLGIQNASVRIRLDF